MSTVHFIDEMASFGKLYNRSNINPNINYELFAQTIIYIQNEKIMLNARTPSATYMCCHGVIVSCVTWRYRLSTITWAAISSCTYL